MSTSCACEWAGNKLKVICFAHLEAARDGLTDTPMRVFCPAHDEYRARYTMGRPELDDRCPRCVIASLSAELSTAQAALGEARSELARREEFDRKHCMDVLVEHDEYEAMKSDAERGRYLMSIARPIEKQDFFEKRDVEVRIVTPAYIPEKFGEHVRAAIDQAREGKEASHEG